MAKKVEILFTGLNNAKFKTGNSMMREVRKHVKESGKGNVSLVHGGRSKVSKIDRNVIKLGEITGLNVISDPLDFSHKNATGIRDQKRIDNPNLIHYSYDSKGNLSLKDKYAGYWKNKYGAIGKETTGEYHKGKTGRILKFPRSTVKDNKVIGKQTKETSKFKSLLDEIEDDTNPERQASGVTYAKNLDKWTKENLNINMITEKNQGRIDYLESGGVMTKGEKGTPTLIRQEPSFKREVKSIDDFEQKTYVEDTSVIGKGKIGRRGGGRRGRRLVGGVPEDSTSGAGRRGGDQLIRNKVTGEVIEKTNKYRVKGTLLTGPTVVSVNRTGGMTDAQIARKNPYPQSSMSQLGSNQELDDYKGQGREVTRKVELKDNLKQLTDQTDLTEKGYGEDKTKSGKGIERHTTSHLIKEQPIKDRVELKRTMKKFAPVFKRLAEAETKVKAGTNKPKKLQNLKRLDNVARNLAKQIPDRLAFDAAQPSDTSAPARSSTVQSSGLKNVPVPKATKLDKIKATKAKIAKGPLGGKKGKGTGWWEGTRRRVTPVGKGNFPFALSAFSTVLTPFVAHKKAKKDLGRNPTTLEALNYTLPSFARKKQSRYNDPI